MRHVVAKCLLAFFASLLMLILVEEIMTLFQTVNSTSSAVDFNEDESGV